EHAEPRLHAEEADGDAAADERERGLHDARAAPRDERRERDAEHPDEADRRQWDPERVREDGRPYLGAGAGRVTEDRRRTHVIDEQDRARDERCGGDDDSEPEPDLFPHETLRDLRRCAPPGIASVGTKRAHYSR